jgi:hypothetical protein
MAGDNNIAETDGAAQSSVFAVTSAPAQRGWYTIGSLTKAVRHDPPRTAAQPACERGPRAYGRGSARGPKPKPPPATTPGVLDDDIRFEAAPWSAQP